MIFGRALALVLALTGFCLAAPADKSAQVSGVIVDASGAVVPGAIVTVVNEDTGSRRIATSQADGGFNVSSLEPGSYQITVRKFGFRTMIHFGVKVTEAQTARVDFKLIVGSLQETVTVEGTAPLLQHEEVATSTVVTRGEIDNLPVNGGGLLTLLEFAPGTVVTPATRGEAGQFTVNGQRPNTHYFMVDGISANSGVGGGGLPAQSTGGQLPGFSAYGSLDSLVSLDALEEMRVQTSTTMSDFGRMPGAQVSLTSRSGSNDLHGSVLYAFRHEALGANDWFANRHGDPRADQRENNVAATLGGALWRDHTFFFLSYEAMRLTQPFVFNQPVPTLLARQNAVIWAVPLLSLFPAPNGPNLGNNLALWTSGISRPSRLDTGAIRIDHAFNSRLSGFTRYNDSPSSTDFGSQPENSLDLHYRSITLGLDLRARPNLLLNFRENASYASAESVWGPGSPTPPPACFLEPTTSFFLLKPGICDYLVRLTIAGVGQVTAGSEGKHTQSQYQSAATGIWDIRNHSAHFGVDYRRLAPKRHDATGSISLLGDSVQDLDPAISLFWSAESSPQDLSAVLSEISLFAQDTWRITPRLTATFGLRWEISPAPQFGTPANFIDPTTGVLTPSQQSIWRSTYDNFAPRVGAAWQIGKRGRTVLRGGYGSYFDSSLSLATDLVNDGPLNVSNYQRAQSIFRTIHFQFGFLPDLHLPRVDQWNAAVEHAFSDHDLLTAGYQSSSSDNLIRREVGGTGSSQLTLVALATNHGLSEYHALETQYRRRLSNGLQVLASYAWSHSIDNSSTDAGLYWAAPGFPASADRASSDFDVRHSFTAGFTYETPVAMHSRFLRGWAIDGTFRARSGFPINILNAEQFQGVAYQNISRPDLLPGVPIWLDDPMAPGSRRINPAAFRTVPLDAFGNPRQGNLGRNALTGFGMSQFDLALRREFFAREQRSLQLRIEAFNAFNHDNFADPNRFLSSALFGQSTSMLNLMLGTGSPSSGLAPIFQAGGPRSVQISVKFKF